MKSEHQKIRHHKGGLPGFGLTMGYTLFYMSIIVLLPLSVAFWKSFQLGWQGYCNSIFNERVMIALRLSFGTAFIAALINAFVGTIFAWVLTRYTFPGRRILDAMMDLPFALPTAVAGIALTTIYGVNGCIGSPLYAIGIKVAYTPVGIVLALVFVSLPFVVRTVQPVLEFLETDVEEAATVLGATRLTTLRRIVLPTLYPSILTGFALSFARGLGEYGSVVFISGNMPMRTEIAPLLMVSKLEQYDIAGATALAVTMLVISFICLLSINLFQRWSAQKFGQTC